MADIDLALGTDRDISVEDGDLKLCAGVELVTQRVIVGLRLFLGEWFADEEAGTPYYRDVLVDQPKSNLVEAMFRRQILTDADIERIDSFTFETDRRYRQCRVTFSATSSQGKVNASEVFP